MWHGLVNIWRGLGNIWRRCNHQVARYLLENGLKAMEAVVFLDGNDAKMVLMRTGMKVIKLEQCGVAKDKRLSFYDQVRVAFTMHI
jgi:hypothetical protein